MSTWDFCIFGAQASQSKPCGWLCWEVSGWCVISIHILRLWPLSVYFVKVHYELQRKSFRSSSRSTCSSDSESHARTHISLTALERSLDLGHSWPEESAQPPDEAAQINPNHVYESMDLPMVVVGHPWDGPNDIYAMICRVLYLIILGFSWFAYLAYV